MSKLNFGGCPEKQSQWASFLAGVCEPDRFVFVSERNIPGNCSINDTACCLPSPGNSRETRAAMSCFPANANRSAEALQSHTSKECLRGAITPRHFRLLRAEVVCVGRLGDQNTVLFPTVPILAFHNTILPLLSNT